MRFREIFESKECKDVFRDVNEFSTQILAEYNTQIEAIFSQETGSNEYNRGKDVFDFVWGTVELTSAEICLLDSPLLQRLRNIKQLGFGHTVYCNADYSRFAHTIGVVEASGRMANVVAKELSKKRPTSEEEAFNLIEIVRLAAILHDCGHLFYSHVSESYFIKNPRYVNNAKFLRALNYFCKQVEPRAAFHEMLSVMIVNSDEMFRFFNIIGKTKLRTRIRSDEDVNQLREYISGLIVGTAVDKNILPFSNIIKGTVDADRMDYLSRDSCTTKVPLAVDIGRLINKITVVKLRDYVPKPVWFDHTEDDNPYLGMAIRYSAKQLIWQLAMAREILYQSVYFHHKKLTAEAMFKRACERVFSLIPDYNFNDIMMLTDQEFGSFFTDVMIPHNKQLSKECKEIKEIFKRIRYRDLYKRVACISRSFVSCEHESDYGLFVTCVIENPFSDYFEYFIKNLTEEYYSVLSFMEKPIPTTAPVFMFIEANWKSEGTGDIPIDFGNDPYEKSSKVFTETPTCGEANVEKQYYLVTDQKDRDLVYIAFEHLLFHLKRDEKSKVSKIRISDGAATCAKFTSKQIADVKSKLFKRDFYYDSLELLPDRVLKTLYEQSTFDQVLNKYQTFSGVNDSRVNEDSLIKFLRQFLYVKSKPEELKLLLNGVLNLLRNATFLDRNHVSTSMTNLIKRIREDEKKNNNLVVKLGGFFDSANRLSYYFNDVRDKEGFSFFETVKYALDSYVNQKEDSCIVFFDDGAYSGKQVVSIFQELMGIPIERRETDEKHVPELDLEYKNVIKTARIILAYVCFNPDSESWILEQLGALGISNVRIMYERSLSDKTFAPDNPAFESEEQCEIVRKKMSDIGYQVQKASKTLEDGTIKSRWDEKRFKEAALGYNDAQQMVFFDVNVPTYTVTPFWQNGKYENNDWRGLFQRTEK